MEQMERLEPFVAHTHREWYDFLSTHASAGRLDEVNFWFPRSQRLPKQFRSGEPVFFRLGAPERKIAGYGFFAYFNLLQLGLAWETFGYRNGAPDRSSLYRMLGRFTSEDMTLPLACMVLLDAHFWPDARWILWDETRGYASSGIQLGRTERDPRNVDTLLAELRGDAVEPPPELLDRFEPLFVDERKTEIAEQIIREAKAPSVCVSSTRTARAPSPANTPSRSSTPRTSNRTSAQGATTRATGLS